MMFDQTPHEYHKCPTCKDWCCESNVDPEKCSMCRWCRKETMAGRKPGANSVTTQLRKMKGLKK